LGQFFVAQQVKPVTPAKAGVQFVEISSRLEQPLINYEGHEEIKKI
jgi:hypothetical protein